MLTPPFRCLAHMVIVDGHRHPMSVLSVDADGKLSVAPFERETEGTAFVSGTIIAESTPGNLWKFRILC